MQKIMPQRALLGYSIVLALCSMFMAANFNLRLASQLFEGINLNHISANLTPWVFSSQSIFHYLCSLFLILSVLMAVIFFYSTVATIVGVQAKNLATLSLLGANRGKILIFFSLALLRPFSIAIALGVIVGVLCDRFLALAYIRAYGFRLPGFDPSFHFSSLLYTCLIMFAIFPLAVLLSLKKLWSISPLGLAQGSHKNFAKFSRMRLIAGVIVWLIIAWYTLIQHAQSNPFSSASTILYQGVLEVIGFYLVIPVILKLIVPLVLGLLSKFLPITGLFTYRYFHANIRRYVSVLSPIIICLVFSVMWFIGVLWTGEVDASLFTRGISISATVPDIPPDQVKNIVEGTAKHPPISTLDKGVHALPIREDDRWAEKGKNHEIFYILEVKPSTLSAVIGYTLLAGDISQVHGTNIASTRPQDKLGELIHLISPEGKDIAAHIVAILQPNNNLLFNALIGDYASLPHALDTMNPDNIPPRDQIFSFERYDIFYTGVTPAQLRAQGLSAISYAQFIHQGSQREANNDGKFIIQIIPVIVICLCFVIINSSAFSDNSSYIRKVTRILGGAKGQDLRILFLELALIFLFTIFIAPLPALLEMLLMQNHISQAWHMQIHFLYPTQRITIILGILAMGAVTPPILKTLWLRKNEFMRYR